MLTSTFYRVWILRSEYQVKLLLLQIQDLTSGHLEIQFTNSLRNFTGRVKQSQHSTAMRKIIIYIFFYSNF